MVAVNVKGVDELTAVIPHLLGFQPTESMVVVPLSPGPPVARIDLPTSVQDRQDASQVLLDAYLRHAQPGSQLAIVCFTEDLRAAELASRQLGDGLNAHGVDVPARLWVTDEQWTNLDTGQGGDRTRAAQTMMAAEFVMAGRQAPAAARDALAAQLVGDRAPVGELLTDVHDRAVANGSTAERAWASDRLDRFDVDGRALSDRDAARLLVAVQDLPTRDDALMRITSETASSSRALWTDLTRRSPDEVRTPAATLLGFSSWLGGDGAGAWVALDQIPVAGQPYRLADLLAEALQQAVPPSAWENASPRGAAPEPGPGAWQDVDRPGPRRLPDPPSLGGPQHPGPRPPAR